MVVVLMFHLHHLLMIVEVKVMDFLVDIVYDDALGVDEDDSIVHINLNTNKIIII